MGKLQNLLRLIFAAIFLSGAAVNAYLLVLSPGIYRGFADLSFLQSYRQLWADVIFPQIALFIGLVVALELGIAVLLLWKGAAVRFGLLAAVCFMVALIPFWWGGGSLINLGFALVFLWMMRFDYPLSIPSLLRGADDARNR